MRETSSALPSSLKSNFLSVQYFTPASLKTPRRKGFNGKKQIACPIVLPFWLGDAVGTDLYFDPHVKHSTGEQTVLEDW